MNLLAEAYSHHRSHNGLRVYPLSAGSRQPFLRYWWAEVQRRFAFTIPPSTTLEGLPSPEDQEWLAFLDAAKATIEGHDPE